MQSGIERELRSYEFYFSNGNIFSARSTSGSEDADPSGEAASDVLSPEGLQ